MARSGGEGPVRRLELIDQAEGPRAVAAREIVEREVGGDIGGVALFLDLRAVFDEDRIEVFALARVDAPVVEAARILANVVFADEAGLIAGVVQ